MAADQESQDRTTALFAWLNQVKADNSASLPASAFKVAFELGQYVNKTLFSNERALIAWPALETIAAGIAMSERTARDMVKRLEARGHLSIEVGHGPGHPSRYLFLMKNRQQAAGFIEEQSGSRLPLSKEQNRQPAATKPAGCRTETGSRLPTNHCEPSFKHEGGRTRATFIPDDFRLTGETYTAALSKLGSKDAVDRLTERFVNYHRQVDGRSAKSRDWQAKFLLWVVEDAGKPGRVTSSSGNAHGITDAEWDDMASTYVRFDGRWNSRGIYGPPPSDPACVMPEKFWIKHNIAKRAAA